MTNWKIILDGDVFAMSSRDVAIAACEANTTGGIVVAPDGNCTPIAPKAQRIEHYPAGDNFSEGPS